MVWPLSAIRLQLLSIRNPVKKFTEFVPDHWDIWKNDRLSTAKPVKKIERGIEIYLSLTNG